MARITISPNTARVLLGIGHNILDYIEQCILRQQPKEIPDAFAQKENIRESSDTAQQP